MKYVNFVLVLLLATADFAKSSKSVQFEYIHDGNHLISTSEILDPVYGAEFGSYPFWCIGNLLDCYNGFTLTTWIKPEPLETTSDAVVILSNGAHLGYSNGFYVKRSWGDQYEVGVSLEDRNWKVAVQMVAETWIHVAFTWSDQYGLRLFVDGFLKGEDAYGTRRGFVYYTFDPVNQLMVGGWRNGDGYVPPLSCDIVNITMRNEELTGEAFAKMAADGGLLYIGCNHDVQASSTILIPRQYNFVDYCRQRCAKSSYQIARISHPNRLCECLNATELSKSVLSSDACDNETDWEVHYICHVTNRPTLTVKIEHIEKKPDVFTGQYVSVSVTVFPDLPNKIVVNVDFDDGNTLLMYPGIATHSFSKGNTYKIKATATMGIVISEDVTEVKVVPPMIDEEPEYVGIWGTHKKTSRLLSMKTSLVDALESNCSLKFGDTSNPKSMKLSGYIKGFESEHRYDLPGQYNASVTCENKVGSTSSWVNVLSRNFELNRVIHTAGTDFAVNISGSETFKKTLHLAISDKREFGSSSVIPSGFVMKAVNFAKSNTYLANVVTPSGKSVTRYAIDSQILLQPPEIILNTPNGIRGTLVSSQFVLHPGQRMNVKLRYDIDTVDYTYYSNQETVITMARVVRFEQLGYFPVSLEVSNDVSHFKTERVISIEEGITEIAVTAVNGSVLEIPVPITVDINPHGPVALRARIQIDYGDGTVEDAVHDNEATDGFNVTLNHKYKLYGGYPVHITVSNQISSIKSNLFVMVGEGVTRVKISRSSDRIEEKQFVDYTVLYETGINVTFSVNLGNGHYFELPEIAFENELSGIYVHGPHSKLIISAKKKKGRLIYSTSDGSTIIDLEQKKLLRIKHKYSTVGNFAITIIVSNVFNSISKSMCPLIVSLPSTKETLCTKPAIVLPHDVQTIMRAQPAIFQPRVDIGCPENYTFTIQLSRIEGPFSQEETYYSGLCIVKHVGTSVEIPKLTLPYGWFLVRLTLSPFGHDMLYTTVLSTLEVQESDIIAKLSGGKKLDVYVVSSTVIDMSGSRHPDVAGDGRAGLEYDVFCSSLDYKDDLDDIFHPRLNITSDVVIDSFLYPNTTHNPIVLHDLGGCFDKRVVDIKIDGGKLKLPTSELSSKTDTFYLRLFVSREETFSDVEQTISVRSSNDSSEYDQLDDLLASGDVGTVLKIVSVLNRGLNNDESEANSKAKDEKKNKRSKLINVIGKMAANITDSDTIGETVNALAGITQTKDEVSQESRKAATDAVAMMTKATERIGGDLPLEKAMGVGQGIMATLSNLYPDEKKESIFMLKSKENEKAEKGKTEETPEGQLGEVPKNDEEKEDSEKEPKEEPEAEEEQHRELTDEEEAAANVEKVIEALLKEIVGTENPSWNTSTYRRLIKYYYPGDMDEFKMIVDENHPDDLKDFLLDELNLEEEEEKAAEKEADKQVANMGSGAIAGLAKLALSKISENGSVGLNSSKLELKVAKINASDTAAAGGMSDPAAGFVLPPSALMGGGNLGVQMSKSKVNQFTWEEGSEDITGGTFSLSLNDDGGGEVAVKDTGDSSPISFWLDSSTKGKPKKVKIYTVHQTRGKVNINYHFINHTNKDLSMRATIRPMGRFKLTLYLKFNGFPNDTFYDYKETIPKNAEDYLEYNGTDLDHLLHTIVVPLDITRKPGVYRMGISSQGKTNHSYTFQFFETGCRYRDVVNQRWSGDGCKVGHLSTYESTNCLCTHLTSFGGNFVVPPNTIDFNTVWAKFKDLSENAAVFGTVISILIFYVLVIIWARHADKKDITKWGAIPLEDNLPSDTYHYQISVHTGTKKTASTKSKVSFVISGDESDTGVRRLSDGKRKELGRGSILNYVLSVENSLGSLSFLRIWHDNSGKGKLKSWFFEQMEVIDLQTNEKFIFLCDKWLAVEEDDGMIERIIPVAGINDLINFKHLFSTSVRKKLSNEHLWFSVLSRPTRSNFTRVQRLSCCLSLLFLTMITNAMWFKSEENMDTATALRIGPFAFTLEQVFISFMSTMIVFPPSFLLITLFRRCRTKKNNILQSNQTMPKQSQKYKWKSVTNSGLWSGPEKSKADKFKDTMTRILDFHRGKMVDKEVLELETKEANKKKGKKEKKKGWSLPHWCLYLAWLLCFISVIAPAFFTILYSMEWGAEKANEWLITFVMSFFESVIVVQPVKVLCLVAFLACVLKKPDLGDDDTVDDDAHDHVAQDEELINKTSADINSIMLQRKRACEDLRPPDTEALEASRQLRMQEIKMEKIIKEIIIYGLFLLILFFISYQTRDDDSFFVANNLKNIFVSSNFQSITTPADYWKWLYGTLLPSLYASGHFNDSKLKWWDKNCIADLASRRVGVARLRQMRVKPDSCYIPSNMDTVINHCRNGYSWTDDDTKTYYKGWRAEPLHKNESLAKQKYSPWDYQNSLQLKNAPYYGKVTMYKGGGYTYVFKRSVGASTRELQQLQRKNWIDLKSRAVFLEFTLYNPNVNLFTSAIMLVEFLPTGAAFTKTDFKVFRLYSYLGAFGIIVVLFEVIYVCFTIYFLVHAIKKLRVERCKYFKNFWNVLEFVLLILSLIAIIMYAIKHVIANYSLNALKKAGSGEFVNFQSLSLYDEFFTYVVGTVVFLSTLQFLKLLQFNRRMNMLGDTIKLSFKDLKLFSITFFIYFVAFGMFAFVLFGTTLAAYGNFTSTLESLFAFALGDFDFDAMYDSQRILGPIFFFMYVAIVYVGLMGIFLTIIYEAFAQVKGNADLQSNDHEIVDFIWKKVKGILGVK